MDCVYTIPVVAQDLRQEENIIQIADTLEHLSCVINDVFKRINQRIDDNIARTQSVAKRISFCGNKIERLTGTKNATNVLSSSKYPGMECHKNYESLFSHRGEAVTVTRTADEIKSRPTIGIDKEHQEKLEFYHVKISQPDARRALLESRPPEGLGPLPSNTPSMGCLLLYGTGETVYGATEKAPIHSRGQQPVILAVADNALDAAPFSMSNREKGTGKAAEPYMYSPGMGEVPEMDVPQDLPRLTGVAGDLQFLSEAERVIAPSAATVAQPSETLLKIAPEKQSTQPTVPESNTEASKSATVLETEMTVKKAEEIVMVKKEEVKPSAGPPPPPLPPPPPALPPPLVNSLSEPDSASKQAQSTSSSKSTAVKSAPLPALDDRANLMEAIRNAGGLKKAKLRNTEAVEIKEAPPNSGGKGDLMADLHAKLSMRRKGISGDKNWAAQGTILGAMVSSPMIMSGDVNTDNTNNSDSSSCEDGDWD